MLSALVIAAATFSAANVDTILGKWVCISHRSSASAGSPARPFTGAVLELRWDGVATYYRGGEAWFSRRFMRESGKEWASRFKGSQYLNDGIGIWGEYERPGVEMIYFQKGGKFKVTGEELLPLDPSVPMLGNSLGQVWCRVGDESRVWQVIRRRLQARRLRR